jgi:hypothetical protein
MVSVSLSSRWVVSFIGILVAVLAVVAGALLVSAHQGDGGTYGTDFVHACRQNNNGQLKYVGPNGTCKNNETPIHWPASQGGISVTRVEGQVVTSVPDHEGFTTKGDEFSATAACPAGSVLTGGGGLITHPLPENVGVALLGSYPSSTTEWTATLVFIENAYGGLTATVQAFALCSP